jgi:hypothetical protein
MSSRILNIASSDEWNALIGELEPFQRDVFQTPEHYRIFEQNGDGTACCFVFQKG